MCFLGGGGVGALLRGDEWIAAGRRVVRARGTSPGFREQWRLLGKHRNYSKRLGTWALG